MIQENRRHGIKVLAIFFSLSFVFLLWHGCGGGGGGSDSGTTPTKSVVITGTVPGTVAIAYDKATGKEAARDFASGTPKTFSLNVAPGDYYLMFIENEDTANQTMYSFQNITGGNVFTCKATTTLNLGIIDFDPVTKIAKPQTNPLSGNDNVTETVTPPADFSGAWMLTRKIGDDTPGCPGQPPGTMDTTPIFLTQDGIAVTLTSPDIDTGLTGVANVNTINLSAFWQSAPYSAVLTMDLTKQSDGSLAGSYSKVGDGGECSNSATLTAVRSTPGQFTAEMLAGKVFAAVDETPAIIVFDTSTFTYYESEGNLPPVFGQGSWSISNGKLIMNLPSQFNVNVTLLADNPTYMDVRVDDGINPPENDRLTKVIDFVAATLPGIYTAEPPPPGKNTITFVAGGTGSATEYGVTDNFTWSVDEGVLILTLPVERDTIYLLAGSTTTNLNIAGITYENGTLHDVYAITLIQDGASAFDISGKWEFTVTATSISCSPTVPPPEVSVGTIVQNGNDLFIDEIPGVPGTINGNAVHISGTDTSGAHPANVTMDLTVQPGGLEMTGTYLTVQLDNQCQVAGDVVAVRIP